MKNGLNQDMSGLLMTSTCFCKDKTKKILFTIKRKIKNVSKANRNYNNLQIKYRSRVKYLDVILAESTSRGSMTLYSRFKLLDRKTELLTGTF